MTEHKYAQVLRWIADGKKVQWLDESGIWYDQDSWDSLEEIAFEKYPNYRYRLAPRTVKVGDVEIEAALNHLDDNQLYWRLNALGVAQGRMNLNPEMGVIDLRDHLCFATKEAAEAAHAAWVKLMRGDAA